MSKFLWKSNLDYKLRNSNFKQNEETTTPAKLCAQKFYVHEIAAVNLSKINFLKNAKKTCKPNNLDLNRDWISRFYII